MSRAGKVVAICGGIGGAKLALGLSRILPAGDLTVVVNTGDDFEHLGLHISPDLDTVLYTLSGLADRERGWGRGDETWNFMAALGELGGETWFNLGDRDLALHVARTEWLRGGGSLSDFAQTIADALGIAARIVPMSDDPVRTMVDTNEGELAFQRYFVGRRCEPAVTAIRFAGAETARPASSFLAALADSDLAAVLVCPSNPWLSIDPILAVPGVRSAVETARAPVVAVSPLIGGKAVKGPTAKIMGELGIPATSASIAAHYAGLMDGLVVDSGDAAEAGSLPIPVRDVPTLMQSLADRERLARDVLAFAADLSAQAPAGKRRAM
jgi:LPPG:FO 2-phospho-L-lactate transferase